MAYSDQSQTRPGSAHSIGAAEEDIEVLPDADKSLGQLFGDLTSDVSTLVRQEIQLAKLEAAEELKQAGKAGGMFAGAALSAHMALIFLSLALAWLLSQALNTALSFAIVGIIYVGAAAVLALQGKAQMSKMKSIAPNTTQSLKEDVAWAKARKN